MFGCHFEQGCMPRSMSARHDGGRVALQGVPARHSQDAARADAVPAVHREHVCTAARHGGMPAVYRTL